MEQNRDYSDNDMAPEPGVEDMGTTQQIEVGSEENTPEIPQPPVEHETVAPTQRVDAGLNLKRPPFEDTREVPTDTKNDFEIAKKGKTADIQQITVEQRLKEAKTDSQMQRAIGIWRKWTGFLGGKKNSE